MLLQGGVLRVCRDLLTPNCTAVHVPAKVGSHKLGLRERGGEGNLLGNLDAGRDYFVVVCAKELPLFLHGRCNRPWCCWWRGPEGTLRRREGHTRAAETQMPDGYGSEFQMYRQYEKEERCSLYHPTTVNVHRISYRLSFEPTNQPVLPDPPTSVPRCYALRADVARFAFEYCTRTSVFPAAMIRVCLLEGGNRSWP
jgi:hypothetical protein